VYSVEDEAVVVVPIARVVRTPVRDHRVVRLALGHGAVLEISPGHPTADGRRLGDLRAGDTLDGVVVESAELVSYAHPFTYDVLPASATGIYFTAGVPMGSTLRR
jgi:hypothetical protein